MTDANSADFLGDHTETTLSIRERELLGVIETIPAMLWVTGPDGEPTHLSQRFLEYRGASFEQFVNRGWERFIHPEDRGESAKAFFRAIEAGESFNVIHRYRRVDGEYRWHHVRGEPLRDPHGKIIQWYGLSIDIDEWKRAENHLQDTRIKLSTASKIAAVAELSASIAHQLNQPFMAVLGNAQAAKRWLATNPPNLVETTASIERILRDIRLADETMQRIRALFNSEPFEKRDESVLDIIRESLRLVHEDPKMREVRIDCPIEGSLPPICVDRIQIQQVFINLISNAIEATDGMQIQPGFCCELLLHRSTRSLSRSSIMAQRYRKDIRCLCNNQGKGHGHWPGRLKIHRRSPRRAALGGEQS